MQILLLILLILVTFLAIVAIAAAIALRGEDLAKMSDLRERVRDVFAEGFGFLAQKIRLSHGKPASSLVARIEVVEERLTR